MSQKLVTVFCLALLVAVGFGKDEVKDAETKKIVKAPAVVGSNASAEVVETKTGAAAPRIGAGTTGAYTCYQCNSASIGQEACESSDREQLAPFAKACAAIPKGTTLQGQTKAVQCRKILQEVEGEAKRIIRECAYTGGEEEIDAKRRTGNKGVFLYYYSCDNTAENEPCNPASQAIVSLGAFVVVAVAQLFQHL